MDMDRYIGRLLDDRYEILEVIGNGGMAVVYKARCHRLNRLVAIKILKDEFSRDEEFRRRFHAEGEAVAMLSHPNIVQVYDVSSTDNADFIVMELIDGITLKQYMEKKGVLNWKETLHFGMQIGKALEHAHGRSIVHRDIKPHNVMVLKNGSVKVTDFGIARVMSKSNTLTKEALGSVHYISPEQAKGGWVDNRTDLYSLGVVMYEMMAGRPPYDGESPVAVAIQHINGGAPMPSSLNPNIPKGMEQIIMKSMALEPKNRYLSATDMLRDMDEFRKDPSLQFNQPKPAVSKDATQVINSAAVAQAVRQPRTTAEKVAGVPAGAQRPRPNPAGGTQNPRPRTSADSQRVRVPSDSQRIRTGGAPRPAGSGSRPVSSDPARRSPARTGQPPRKTREEIRDEETKNRIATVSIVACSIVAIIAIIVFLVVLFNGGLLDKNQNTVTVPNLVNKYYESMPQYQGFQIELYAQVYDETVEKGRVISQEPVEGLEVVQGTVIKVTVSMGPEPVVKTMDNLTNQSYDTAVAWINGQDLGLNPLQRQEFHDDIEEGMVIRTEPAAGEPLEEGQTVWIYVSSGPAIETAKMENLVGKKEKVALSILDALGFKNVDVEYEFNEKDEGIVLEQSETAGNEIDLSTRIVLTVSKGQKTAKMINVVGQTFERAKENLEDLGFTIIVPKEVESEEEKGEVVYQSVSRGTELAIDKEIVLHISKGPAPTEPPTEPPTEAPTAPPEVTIRKTFNLPADRTEDYVLSLRLNGKNVYEDAAILGGTPSITVELTGTGTVYYDLYINGEYYKTEKVVFS